MRCESDSDRIFYQTYSVIRRKNCIGCQYMHVYLLRSLIYQNYDLFVEQKYL